MEFFEKYTSNTLAGSGNQLFRFLKDSGKIYTSRTYYKVFCGGEYNYSVLFSNIVDSTFSGGNYGHKNMVIDSWKIHSARIGITSYCDDKVMNEPNLFYNLTFDEKEEKTVNPGEMFNTDSVKLAPKTGEYLCLELSFSGKEIPYHHELNIPSFMLEDGEWVPSPNHPISSMIGCDRNVKMKIGFIGDSITQGLGTENNSYSHWNSIAADNIGEDYAYWNLGIGFGRAEDAASDGAWLFKAKQNDLIVMCYGVNDILQGLSEESIKTNLNIIVDTLKNAGKKVVIQTIPPFDYEGEDIIKWKRINNYIKKELSKKTEFVFDCACILGKSEKEPHIARYQGHPNAEGCKIWGDRLSSELIQILETD